MPLHCHAPPPQRASAEFGVRPASPSPVVPALLCKQSFPCLTELCKQSFLLKSQCLRYHHHVGFSGRGSSWSLVLPPKNPSRLAPGHALRCGCCLLVHLLQDLCRPFFRVLRNCQNGLGVVHGPEVCIRSGHPPPFNLVSSVLTLHLE